MPRTKPTKDLPADPDATVKISVDVKASGLRWLDEYAAGHGQTRTDVIRAALREYAERHGRPARPAPKQSGK